MNAALLKDRLTVYGQLMRVDKPIGTVLLLWPTLWAIWIASAGHPPALVVLVYCVGTFLMRSAGCVINDYADRDFDGMVERTRNRPFARRAVTGREALGLAAALALASFLLILPFNRLTLLMSVPAVLIAASYPYTKRFFPVPQAYLGIAFSFGIPMAFATLTGTVPALAWLMTFATGLWVVAYDTAYAMTDKPDDLKHGLIKSSAITFGRHDVTMVMLLHAAFLALMAWIGHTQGFGLPYAAGLLAAAGLMGRQYLDIRHRDRQRCFKAFLDNNRVGMAIFAGVLLEYWLRHP